MKYIILFFALINTAHSFTLNNNFSAAFKTGKIKVYVDENTSCGPNLSVYTLQKLIDAAVDNFWNQVPTADLELVPEGFSQGILTMNSGRLCSPTDDGCITSANGEADPSKRVIPQVNGIVIACNNNDKNFGSAEVLAVTVPNNFNGKTIKGAVILLNNAFSSSIFMTLNESDKIGVIAHEIGHALGLGHALEDQPEALMYYRKTGQRKRLGQDDIDGITYLYPIKFDAGGLLGGCGTIADGKNPPKDPPFWQMGISLGVLVLVFELAKLFIRSKARTAA